MTQFHQGDIIKISDFRQKLFLVVSKNAFIKATGVFHVCPLIADIPEGPLHIAVNGNKHCSGTVICEQVKLIDPASVTTFIVPCYRSAPRTSFLRR